MDARYRRCLDQLDQATEEELLYSDIGVEVLTACLRAAGERARAENVALGLPADPAFDPKCMERAARELEEAED